jgi:nucleoside-diphosphate-sugar epimerase
MNVVIFGAAGMVGQGVLRECLRDTSVERALVIGRSSAGRQHAKLQEVLVHDLFDVALYASELTGLDACFFCLGISSAGMSEPAYRHLTYDLTTAIAGELATRSPALCFVYVSGAGTDSTERGRSMWARVKGGNRECTAGHAISQCIHVSAGSHSAARRHSLEDACLSARICADRARAAATAPCFPEFGFHHSRDRTGHACRGT